MAGTASMHQPPSSTPAAPNPVASHNCQNLPQPPWTDLSIKLERPDGHSNSVNNSSGNSSSNNSITGSTDPAQEDRGGTTLQLYQKDFFVAVSLVKSISSRKLVTWNWVFPTTSSYSYCTLPVTV